MTQESRQVYPDADALAKAAGVEVLRIAQESIAARGVFSFALSGGSTPKKLYSLLATDPAFVAFPWDKTQLFFGDERHVPPTDKDSNYRMTSESLLSSGKVPSTSIHRVPAEIPDAGAVAAEYETDLRAFFKGDQLANGFPRFDVVLLGMGPDGHTASLFPGSKGLEDNARWVIANWVEKFKTDRITFTFPVINAARHVLLLIAGADKTDMLHEVLIDKKGTYPVERVQPVDGAKVWMLDQAAAAKLTDLSDQRHHASP
jgi:6-phosphogluconolactonase